MPRLILRASRGYLRMSYFSFSIPILVRTLFAPWRRDVQSMDGQPLSVRLQILLENLMSRLFGLLIRTMTLCAGSFILLTQAAISGLVFALWFLLPFLAVVLIGLSIRLLGGGL